MTINHVKNELPESPPFLPFLSPPCFVSLRAPGLLLPPLVQPVGLPELLLLLLPPPPLAFLRGAIARTAGAGKGGGLPPGVGGAGAAAGEGRSS